MWLKQELQLSSTSKWQIGRNGVDDDQLFEDDSDDRLTGGRAANFFSCGPGTDTLIDFNAAEGDTKTGDCENF